MEWLGVDRRRLGTGMLVFGLGVAMLAAMAVLVIAAITHARSTIEAEAGEVLRERRAPPGGGSPAPARG